MNPNSSKNINSQPQYKTFGAGRWIIYSLGFLIFGLTTILILKVAIKDTKNYSHFKLTNATVGYKENACSTSDHSQSLYDYSATGVNNTGYIIRCSDRALTSGQQLQIYTSVGTTDAYISKSSLQSSIGEEFLFAVGTGAISAYFIYGLKKHRIMIGDSWRNSFRH